MRRLTSALLLTGLMTLPGAEALSSVTLPISVPLAGVQLAANAQVPLELAQLDQTQTFLGGLLAVKLTGKVVRTGQVSVKPDGDTLLLSVPIRADIHVAPTGLGAVLARDFGGAATVTLRLKPEVTSDWQASLNITGDYAWTDPLSVELAQGVKVSVQSLVDSQLRAQLNRVATNAEKAVREGADLRKRAGKLWARVQQPWALPAPQPAYALVRPEQLTVSPFQLTSEAIKITAGATFDLKVGLGGAPQVAPLPLPTLQKAEMLSPGVELRVPVRLPYPELSQLATQSAAARPYTLPVPLRPVLRVTRITLKPAGAKISAAVHLEVSVPLGLRVSVISDVTGLALLDKTGQVVTLGQVSVQTRRSSVTGKVVSWLADERATAYISQAVRIDLSPQLENARTAVQQRLPASPVPGFHLSGTVGPLSLEQISVAPGALMVTGRAKGTLAVTVDAGAFP